MSNLTGCAGPPQVEFGEGYIGAEDEVDAYEELKAVIRGCLDVGFRTRLTAQQAQKSLFDIIQARSWSHDVEDSPSPPEVESFNVTDAQSELKQSETE